MGRVAGLDFRLHKRRYWRNDFAPVLYGSLIPEARGTRVEAYWAMQAWTTMFMRLWIVLVICIGAPLFIIFMQQLISAPSDSRADSYVGVIVPPALILWGLLLPRLGAALGFHERKPLVEFLQQILVAGPVATKNMDSGPWHSPLE